MSPKQVLTSIAVYRKHADREGSPAPTLYSPCLSGDMCGICVAHLRGKKRNTPCMMLTPTIPAFYLPAKQALGLVTDGLAVLVNGGTAIQLKFSRLAHLRDASCKIDEAMLIQYAEGRSRARAAVDDGWQGVRIISTAKTAYSPDGVKLVSLATWTPEQMAQSQERVQSFT